MAAVSQPDPAATTSRGDPTRQTGTGTRRAAPFASGLQRSDTPTSEMAAEASKTTVRRFGIEGCASRMAQKFGDHPDAYAERMRWICQLTAETPAGPQMPAGVDRANSRAGNETKTRSGHYSAATGLGTRPERHRAAQRREDAA